ncbi:DUF2807 domain-containing protein [Pontibacter qinzhouensis]|uniref:DUF2807 domain-containing protein n=1 Tax=Pontibacter qinzhouensis TaxID=2603253 RepID=A0A5C8KDC8_9BACT|nr:head GIN domain-containing protein [Pontibacter qinzhouensis]TXK52420.1 DUF2807 domain-containing protein [Pontibacter qinzhouensis]
MKPITLLNTGAAALFTIFVLSGCGDEVRCSRGQGDVETRTMQLANFRGVEVNGSSRVYISYGPQQRVEVKAEPNVLDAINQRVSDGIWRIETDKCFRKHETIEVYITSPAIDYTEINGSGEIVINDRFEANEFTTQINGSGKIKANFTAEHAFTRITGSGKAELQGAAEQQDVSISGSGKAHTFNLATERAIVTISGSGDAEVLVADILEANITGSGRVYYKGTPTVNSRITGSGKVEKR